EVNATMKEKADELGRRCILTPVGAHDFEKEHTASLNEFKDMLVKSGEVGDNPAFKGQQYVNFISDIVKELEDRHRRITELMRDRTEIKSAIIDTGEENKEAGVIE